MAAAWQAQGHAFGFWLKNKKIICFSLAEKAFTEGIFSSDLAEDKSLFIFPSLGLKH